MAMERLSSLDRVFLAVENRVHPMTIGAQFDGTLLTPTSAWLGEVFGR
jgi:hypothetical protein